MNSPIAANANTITITVRHPDGSVVLRVPADVPLGELMREFLEVIGRPDADVWALSPAGGEPYPKQSTFAELGVDDGARLILHEATGAAPSAGDSARAFPAQPNPAFVAPHRVRERPLSDRTARALPVRLSRPERSRLRFVPSHTPHHGINRPCRVGRGVPARPRSLGRPGSRQCRGCGLPGRKPTTGTGWIR